MKKEVKYCVSTPLFGLFYKIVNLTFQLDTVNDYEMANGLYGNAHLQILSILNISVQEKSL